jgi:hypothetical protein
VSAERYDVTNGVDDHGWVSLEIAQRRIGSRLADVNGVSWLHFGIVDKSMFEGRDLPWEEQTRYSPATFFPDYHHDEQKTV